LRNLAEHPLTAEEAIRITTNISKSIQEEMRFGDMRPYTLRIAAEFIDRHKAAFEKFVSEAQ
jgi:hypothetical protein